MSGDRRLVSVIIPAYNAAETIDETLRSVLAQTHTALEIIVVDDGSQDQTAAIVTQYCERDGRVRLICQTNLGVASARNLAIAAATADIIAPVDADDLWAPTKIERQLAALESGGPHVGLVYCWSAVIDEHSYIIDRSDTPTDDGDVLARMCRGNLPGNASCVLLRKEAVLKAGGYDPTLRLRKAQGCEDLLLYYRIARRHRAALVPAFLTGYRRTPGNMSSDLCQMLRSFYLVSTEMRSYNPELEPHIRSGELFAAGWLLRRALRAARMREGARLSLEIFRRKPPLTLLLPSLRWVAHRLRRAIALRRRPSAPRAEIWQRFEIDTIPRDRAERSQPERERP